MNITKTRVGFKRSIVAVLAASVLLCSFLLVSGCGKTGAADDSPQTIEGTLKSFKDSSLVMTSESKELTFDVPKATISMKNMLSGDDIVVTYTGSISGTDTSKAVVTSVEDKGTPSSDQFVITGTVVSASMNSITIKTNDGTQYTFVTTGAETSYKNGVVAGNWVSITYLGILEGTDTSNIKVIKITDDDDNVAQAKANVTVKDVNETVYATADVYIRASYSTDSQQVGELHTGNSIQRTGICDNGWSRVSYNGGTDYIYGDYLTTTAPAQPGGNGGGTTSGGGDPGTGTTASGDPTATSNPTTTTSTITGIVLDAEMSTTEIIDADGNIFTFATASAQHSYTNGVQVGNEVVITYTGDLNGTDTSGVTVVSVSDTNTNSTPTVSGTITGGTMNTVTIKTADGISLTFITDGATNNVSGGLTTGTAVKVTLDVSAGVNVSNLFTATQIDPA